MSEYNVNELFEGIKSFDKNLLFMEKGQRKFFLLAKPSPYNGKLKAIVPVQGYFKGQPNKNPSILVRCYEVPLQSNGNPDFENAKFACLSTNGFVASKLQECFQPGSILVKRPNLLPDNEGKAHLFMLQRVDKNTEFTPSSVAVSVPPSLYEKGSATWEELVEEFNGMQEAMTKKYSDGGKADKTDKKADESTPWDN